MAEWLYGGKTWRQILDETSKSIAKLCKTKGDEYKASDDDQLANFRRRAARFKDMPPELVWAIYAGKHWDAIETYIDDLQTGFQRQRSEPIEGRIDDLIVYLILLKAMCAERPVATQTAVILCKLCGATTQEQIDECSQIEEGCQRIPF